MSVAIAIVGAGPTGTCLMERLCASAPQILDGQALDIHAIDPYPPGGGRIWRTDAPDLLLMNTPAAAVTMFTDPSVRCAGPSRPGPSLAEWIGPEPDGRFAPRPVQGGYLTYVYEQVVRSAPRGVRIHHHPVKAIDLRDIPDGRQRVKLANGGGLDVDAVILTQGYADVLPPLQEQRLAEHADRSDLTYLPSGYAEELCLDAVPSGQPVIIRGMGLAFVDIMVLLTSGRGGRFTRSRDGKLGYAPSGREPLLYAGSRRGVPHHAQIEYMPRGEMLPLPRFLTRKTLPEGRLDFCRDVRPLLAKELYFAYFYELFHAHPCRTRMPWSEFESAFAPLAWDSGQMRALIADAVPRDAYRLDFARLDRPLAGVRLSDHDALRNWMIGHIRAGLGRRADQAYSADVAVIFGLMSAHHVLATLPAGRMVPDPWLDRFFKHYSSGPPGRRSEELLALAEAGIVGFLGSDVRVVPGRTWQASSPSVAGSICATTLIEARLPEPWLSRTKDPLLRRLLADGKCAEEAGLLKVRLPDRRLVDQAQAVHPRRFAFGPSVSGGRPAIRFASPRSNALLLRQVDALAWTVLHEVSSSDGGGSPRNSRA